MSNILVNEIFRTIQGEGTFTGVPALFVRLHKCPVGCPWCDTKYTWVEKPDRKVNFARIMEKEQTGEETDEYCSLDEKDFVLLISELILKTAIKHIVITGGEPCIYDLTYITTKLREIGFSVQVETSGTHQIRVGHRTFVTISPKINMPGKFEVIKKQLARANEIKMPVGKMADIERLESEILPHISNTPIYLQPLSQSEKATSLCFEQALKKGYRISIQTHKYIGAR